MPTEMFIDCLDDGTFQAVHSEMLGPTFLFDLGTAELARASLVEFNPGSGKWEVRWIQDLPTLPPRFENESREACIQWEVQTISEMMNEVTEKLIPRQRLENRCRGITPKHLNHPSKQVQPTF